MKKIYALIVLFSSSFLLNAQKTETRSLSDYNTIKISGGISVELFEGSPSADIEVLKGEMSDLITEVKGDVLHIKFEKSGFFNWNNGNRKAYIKLRGSQGVETVEASAGSYVGSEEIIKGRELEFRASSGASIELDVKANDVYASASSGGSLKLYGTTDSVNLEASSGGTVNAKSLRSDDVEVSASSGGSASVWAEEAIEAKASSGGAVSYKGNPSKEQIKSGRNSGGSVRKIK